MALYFINTSVDTADLNPECIPEDLTINDQESIIELVVEQFLGYENAFVEYDDHDTEDHNKKSNVKLDYFSQYKVDSHFKRYCEESTRHKFPDFADRLLTLSIRPDTPPPKC